MEESFCTGLAPTLPERLNILIAGNSPEGSVLRIETKHSPSAIADITVFMRDHGWSRTSWGSTLVEALNSQGAFLPISTKDQRLKLRLSKSAVEKIGLELEQGKFSVRRPAYTGCQYIVDFCDPNATKAFHVGHLRNLALGHAIASMLEAVGAKVIRQSVVCDFGRSVGEAMAGYLRFGEEKDPREIGIKPDAFIGDCYAAYLAQTESDIQPLNNDPASREISKRCDLADDLLTRLRENDSDALELWRRVRSWVLEGQQATLLYLNVSFDRLIFESDSLSGIQDIVYRGLACGIFEVGAGGSIIYRTGKSQFDTIVLLRSDGFPTEHMRALVLWARLQHEQALDGCLHIMGDEWVYSTIERQEILRCLMPTPLFKHYEMIPYALVSVNGSTMKSSSGTAVLVDDFLALIQKACSTYGNLSASRIIALTYFLNIHPTKRLDFQVDRVLDKATNPGWVIAAAWSRASCSLTEGNSQASLSDDPSYRFALLTLHALPGTLEASLAHRDGRLLIRHLFHFSEWYNRLPNLSPSIHRVAYGVLGFGLSALGLVGDFRDEFYVG